MADRIVGEYAIKVDEAVKNLNALSQRVGKLEKDTEKAAQGTEEAYSKMTSNLMGQFKNLAGVIGIAFSAQQVISLGKEMVTLAAQAEGVERAFKRVGSPQLLEDLRKATRGTVSDLQLMQNAVKASNFKIPLEQLASLFAFAKARASETGESVDYLVDSITTGIGRKSPLILDNLGISAIALKEKLGGVGLETASIGDIAEAVGKIATEELAKMGDQADTTADKIAQIGTSFENAKIKGGEVLILLLEDIENAWERFANITAFRAAEANNALNESFKEGTQIASLRIQRIEKETEAENERLKAIQQALDLADTQYDKEQKVIEQLQHSIEIGDFRGIQGIKELNRIKEQISVSEQYSESLLAQIDVYAKYIEQSNVINEVQKEQIKNVAYYKALIKQLEEEQNAENTTLERNTQLNQELKVAREELARLLGKETEEQKKLREQLEKIAVLRAQEWQMMQSVGVPVTVALSSTIEGLNTLLKEQKQILETSPEFSQRYKDAEAAVAQLEQRLKEFNDSQIDPSQGYDVSATGLGLLPETSDLEQQLDDQLSLYYKFTAAVSSALRSISALQNSLYEQELQALEMRLANEEITRDQYDQERKEILRQQAIDQKIFASFDAAINGAAAIIAAYRDGGPVLAAIVAAAVAAEVATIASQPLPQFAEGGFINEHGQLKGRKHSQGGIKIEAEGGEFITAAKYAQPNAEILRAINTGNWEKYKVENIIAPAIEEVLKGGFDGINGSYQLNSMFNDRNLIKLGDRNRQAAHQDAKYIVAELSKHIKGRKRGGFN